ncbi:hypothetical protein [Bradyrhizobium sp. WD16]|uniref:hypothetical protein n=1 Tax=Bradyrhizobium sp. WD16 TaxID=1521768 RepID=UPI0020A58B65|nr:hypothetical protein [Bradyrhizobium sp. WD16]UTD27182.1 hypothetical protein DB459_09865 [Bradyrhizobium sp. WD16]
MRFDGETVVVARPARLGEHGREVLGEAGLSAEEIEALAAAVRCGWPEALRPRPGRSGNAVFQGVETARGAAPLATTDKYGR